MGNRAPDWPKWRGTEIGYTKSLNIVCLAKPRIIPHGSSIRADIAKDMLKGELLITHGDNMGDIPATP
jgi:hypothetical protein